MQHKKSVWDYCEALSPFIMLVEKISGYRTETYRTRAPHSKSEGGVFCVQEAET